MNSVLQHAIQTASCCHGSVECRLGNGASPPRDSITPEAFYWQSGGGPIAADTVGSLSSPASPKPAVASRPAPARKLGYPGCRCAGRGRPESPPPRGGCCNTPRSPPAPSRSTRSRLRRPRRRWAQHGRRQHAFRRPTGGGSSTCRTGALVVEKLDARSGRPQGAIAKPNLRQPFAGLRGCLRATDQPRASDSAPERKPPAKTLLCPPWIRKSSTPAARSNSAQRSTAHPFPIAFRLISTPRRRNRIVCRSSSSSSHR